MPSAEALLELANAASSQGSALVDAAALRALVDLARGLAVLAAVLAAAAAVLAAIAFRRRAEVDASGAAAARACGELRERLDGMVLKTNERNNYLNSVFSSMEDGFALADVSGRVVLYNPRAEALLGLGPYVFFDDPPPEARHGPEAAAVLAACAEAVRSRAPARLELRSSSGADLDARVVPVSDKYRPGAVLGALAIVKDVTELKRMEALKKDFVATVSHEFRTPLTLISGFTEMFKSMPDADPADRARGFEIMEIETERLMRLVSELLTLSEIEGALPRHAEEPIDVGSAVAAVASSLGELAERKGQVFEAASDVPEGVLRGNPEWFYQAVKNLAENAVKYTPSGGSIRLQASWDGAEVSVSVADTGIGIAEEERGKIFERFYRVDKSRGSGGGGSGLGLALVKDIAAIFGGSVDVESEPGRGSTFTMRLPAPRKF